MVRWEECWIEPHALGAIALGSPFGLLGSVGSLSPGLVQLMGWRMDPPLQALVTAAGAVMAECDC